MRGSPNKLATLVAVVLAHGAMIGLMWNPSPMKLPAEPPTLLMVFPDVVAPPRMAVTVDLRWPRVKAAPPSAYAMQPDESSVEALPTDWNQELKRQIALSSDHVTTLRPVDHAKLAPVADNRPQSHATGEQYLDDTGRWIVWINRYCYQISDQRPLPVAGGERLPPQSYCLDSGGR